MPLILKTNGTEQLRLMSNGNFGVGTSTPQYRLSVNGRLMVSDTALLSSAHLSDAFLLQDGSQGSGKLLVSDGQGKGSWTAFDSVSFWAKNGSDLTYTGGRIGIGINAPTKVLDVNGDALVRQKLFVQSGIEIGGVLRADSSRLGTIEPRVGDSLVAVDGEAHLMDGACVMNGDFGIGTPSPNNKLEVQGDARIHGKTTTDSLRVNGTTEFGYATFDSLKVGDSSIVLGSQTPQPSTSNNTISTSSNGPLLLNPESSNENHTGNVGIGEPSPQRKLHVQAVHEDATSGTQGPEVFGDHAGIRLDNKVDLLSAGSISSQWDIQPIITHEAGLVQSRSLEFSSTSLSNGPLMSLVKPSFSGGGDRIIKLRGRTQVGGPVSGSIELLSSNNGVKHVLKAKDNFGGATEVLHLSAKDGNGTNTEAMAMTFGNDLSTGIFMHRNGKVGIGTDSLDKKFNVCGGIKAREVLVEANGWCDYVFEAAYPLPTLQEEWRYIKREGHLMNVPSAAEVKKKGISLGDMTRVQQRKIEEIYLHLIEMKKEMEKKEKEQKKDEKDEKKIELLKEQNKRLKGQNEKLREQIKLLKSGK